MSNLIDETEKKCTKCKLYYISLHFRVGKKQCKLCENAVNRINRAARKKLTGSRYKNGARR